MARPRPTSPSLWCRAPGCFNGCADKPYCIDHVLLMPYAARVRHFIEDGLAEQCDKLLTELHNKGPQNLNKWRGEVVQALGDAVVVHDVASSKRSDVRRVIFLR